MVISHRDGVHTRERRSDSQLLRFPALPSARAREGERERERETDRERERGRKAAGNDQYYDNSSLSRFILLRPPPLPFDLPSQPHNSRDREREQTRGCGGALRSPFLLRDRKQHGDGGSHVSEARAWPSGCPGQPALSGYRPGCDEKGG